MRRIQLIAPMTVRVGMSYDPARFTVENDATNILLEVDLNADKPAHVGGIFVFDCGDLSVQSHNIGDWAPGEGSTSVRGDTMPNMLPIRLRPGYTEYKFFVKLCLTDEDTTIHLAQTSPFQKPAFLGKAAGVTLSDRDSRDSYILAQDELRSLRYTVSVPIIVERMRQKGGGASPPGRPEGATDSSSSTKR
ncbi:hypothetical protein PENSPDRAFT_406555 [Peniophora sp. CONT]|nr:hypothetical protein PENSPDRAFT_406555 [Peniophora sp. CONT]